MVPSYLLGPDSSDHPHHGSSPCTSQRRMGPLGVPIFAVSTPARQDLKLWPMGISWPCFYLRKEGSMGSSAVLRSQGTVLCSVVRPSPKGFLHSKTCKVFLFPITSSFDL